jgi:hypothetical protein
MIGRSYRLGEMRFLGFSSQFALPCGCELGVGGIQAFPSSQGLRGKRAGAGVSGSRLHSAFCQSAGSRSSINTVVISIIPSYNVLHPRRALWLTTNDTQHPVDRIVLVDW